MFFLPIKKKNVKYMFYDFYDGCFLFLYGLSCNFLAILFDFLLLLLFYKDYTVVERVRAFFGVET